MAATAYANRNQTSATAGALPFPRAPERRKPAAPDRDQCRLKKQLDPILKGIKSPATEETVRHVFSTLSRLREIRSEEHTSELQSHSDLVCRLLLEKKKNKYDQI